VKTFKTTAVLAALLATSAFCAAAQAATPAQPADASDNLVFTGCDEQTSLLILPVSSMPALPAGFSYVTPAGGGALAEIHISGTTCESVNGGAGEQNMLAFALINPPANLMVPEIPYYAIALGGYSGNPSTLAQFEAWGITDLMLPGTVTTKLGPVPLKNLGTVKAVGTGSSVSTVTLAAGPTTIYEGSHTRAYYIRDGVLIASFDAVYTDQASVYSAGTVISTGKGFLPAGIFPTVGSHASDYDLTVGFVEYY
jgi:hypothetical protein